MACVLVPIAEAVVVTAVTAVVKSKENKIQPKTFSFESSDGKIETGEKVSFSRKLSWLVYLLFGGAGLLAFEHVWHGEMVPWFPFLTAVGNPADVQAMLHEMATAGVAMSVLVTVVWVGMVAVSALIEKRAIASGKKATA